MESKEFRMSGGRFAAELVFRYAGVWLLLLSATAVTGVALGIAVDLRWMIAALMVVFIIIPMVLAFLYYYYGLRRECFVNMLPHRIVVEDEGISVRLKLSSAECQENKECSYRNEFFSFSEMQPYRIGTDSVIIPFKAPVRGFIWIPADAFDDTAVLTSALEMIDKGIRRNMD